jgi:hypothetical protein
MAPLCTRADCIENRGPSDVPENPSLPNGPDGADSSSALALLGQLQGALQRDDRALQNDIVRQLIALRAPMGDQWRALANLALQNGELSLTRAAMDLFVSASGDAPYSRYLQAGVLEQCGALGEAYALMRTLPADVPDPAGNAFSLGTAALFIGHVEEARERLELATRLQPQSGAAWLHLAMAVDLAGEDTLAERILTAEPAIAHAPPTQQAAYFYAKGKTLAERGDPPAAFAAFANGARRMKAVAPFDRGGDRRSADQSLSGYRADRIDAMAGRQAESTNRSIFVTGLPRSGTTLVEQILTAHSAVVDGGEIGRLPLLARELGGHSFPALERYVAQHGSARPAQLWRHWLAERFPTPGRIVDKSLDTTRFIGLAAALLPESPLVWLTRDPLDRAWSCLRTFFAAGMQWSYDLEDIAFHFRLEDELLRAWRDMLGARLLVVPFESLVTEPEPWIRRILAHCGLAEEPQVLAPQGSARTVTTASVIQVRRPINRQGVGSAEPYRAFLEPFIRAYYG